MLTFTGQSGRLDAVPTIQLEIYGTFLFLSFPITFLSHSLQIYTPEQLFALQSQIISRLAQELRIAPLAARMLLKYLPPPCISLTRICVNLYSYTRNRHHEWNLAALKQKVQQSDVSALLKEVHSAICLRICTSPASPTSPTGRNSYHNRGPRPRLCRGLLHSKLHHLLR